MSSRAAFASLRDAACYWQASHSSKPGSPGRIVQTGPSASIGAALSAPVGAMAAFGMRMRLEQVLGHGRH
ncbi:hypothetical protein QZM99_36080, partial [Burkholderia gladioli]|uniref:hypothetical protein n=1 Tax=Burkholderia gladioli TaxID=28095 RepID=UPI00264C06CE